MNDQLVSFEVARLLKEKEFDGKSFYHYFQDGRKHLLTENSIHLFIGCEGGLHTEDHLLSQEELNLQSGSFLHTLAPTQTAAQKWIYEKIGVYFQLLPIIQEEKEVWSCAGYLWDRKTKTRVQSSYTIQDTREEALEDGLKTVLKHEKENQI